MDFIRIGHTKRTYGVKGEVKATVEEPFDQHLDLLTFLFFDIEGIKVPFHLEDWRWSGQLLLKFSDVNNPDEAVLLAGQPLYLAAKDLPPELDLGPSDLPANDLLIGFTIVDEKAGPLGPIIRIESYPQQEMAFVLKPGGEELMIPLIEEFVGSISPEQKMLRTHLPEGLLDIN